jgi:hypothetical protein
MIIKINKEINMRRKYLVLTFACVVAISITGCGNKTQATNATPIQTESVIQGPYLSAETCSSSLTLINEISSYLSDTSKDSLLIQKTADASTLWLQQSAKELTVGNADGSRLLADLADLASSLNGNLMAPTSKADSDLFKSTLLEKMAVIPSWCQS